jgi:CRISP-associated protein Cas1
MLYKEDFLEKLFVFIELKKDENTFKFSNDNLVLYKEGKIVNKISLHKIFVVFVIGNCTFTSSFVEKLRKFGISIYLLKQNLECYASIESYASGNFLLRYQQYHLTDLKELNIAKSIIKNKIETQIRLIHKYEKINLKSEILKSNKKIDSVTNSQELLGVEGNVSKLYFQTVFKEFHWTSRRPRSKEDINNFLMDMGYTYLFNIIDSMLRIYGFDTYKGVYHKLFFQRKSLACDIMEPFRVIIDYAIIKAWNLKKIDEADFDLDKINITLKYSSNSKYIYIFLKEILNYKSDIYDYIQKYYRHIMNSTDNPMPEFKFKIR